MTSRIGAKFEQPSGLVRKKAPTLNRTPTPSVQHAVLNPIRKFILFALQIALVIGPSSCAVTGTTRISHPAGSRSPAQNRVDVPVGPGFQRAVPDSALTSTAVLTHVDDETVCFDLLVRTEPGGPDRWTAELAVDGSRTEVDHWSPHACTAQSATGEGGYLGAGAEEASLTPPRSVAMVVPRVCTDYRRPSDMLAGLKIGGGSVCLSHRGLLDRRAYRVSLLVGQGTDRRRFRWLLD